MRKYIHFLVFVSMFFDWNLLAVGLHAESPQNPNFIIIFTDDQGYNDLGCFGSKTIQTPNIDRLAAEGRKYTSFYVPCSVCSPSRVALLTGCYPKRVGMHKGVLFPKSVYGLRPDEVTIADHLKTLGYATACIGKWHLGHQLELLPRKQGFDSYFGIPYSNDMNHPKNEHKPKVPSNELWGNCRNAVNGYDKFLNPFTELNLSIVQLPISLSSQLPIPYLLRGPAFDQAAVLFLGGTDLLIGTAMLHRFG